jgi:hypothetical protein
LSTTIIPAAPPIRALAAFVANAQMPRETRTIVPLTDPDGSVPRLFGSPAAPQR